MGIDHRRAVSLLLCLVLLPAACGAEPESAPPGPGSGGSADGSGTDAEGSSAGPHARGPAQRQRVASPADVTRADADLVIWADESRSAALRPLAEAFGAEHGAAVAVQSLPFEQIRDQLQVAGPDGEGPDVIIGAHEWLGELVPRGMVTPVDLDDRAADFTDVAVSAVTYEGRTYGVPYALASVALLRNTRHVPAAPASWEDLVATVRELRERETVPAGLVLPGDPYHLHPIVTAFGGYLFGRSVGGHDPADLGIASPGSLEAAQRLRDWAEEGVVEIVGSGADAQERFFAGDAALAILDPEATGPADDGGAGSRVGYAVSPVPPVEGGTARPFVRAEAVMVSAFAADIELARRFAVDHLAAEDGQIALAAATGRPPAHRAAAVAAAVDADVAGFAASAGNGVALPAIPETGSVWGPWAEALEQVIAEGGDPGQALSAAAAEVRDLTGR